MPRTQRSSAVPRGALRALVLAALTEADQHGYALARTLEAQAPGMIKISEGTLYPTLHELELEELVDATWTKGPDGRKRRVYSLTRAGRRAAKSASAEWIAIADMLHALLGART